MRGPEGRGPTRGGTLDAAGARARPSVIGVLAIRLERVTTSLSEDPVSDDGVAPLGRLRSTSEDEDVLPDGLGGVLGLLGLRSRMLTERGLVSCWSRSPVGGGAGVVGSSAPLFLANGKLANIPGRKFGGNSAATAAEHVISKTTLSVGVPFDPWFSFACHRFF